jgi:uncharacterized protein
MSITMLRGFFSLAWMAFAATALTAQGIRVSGSGEVDVPAATLVLQGRLEAKAELPGDALKKFADARRRAVEKLETAEIENLEIRGEGFSVKIGVPGQQGGVVFMGGRNQPDTIEPEITAGEMLVVSVPGFGALEAQAQRVLLGDLMDTMKSAGVSFVVPSNNRNFVSRSNQVNAKNPGVYFRPADRKKLETEAYRRALADARDRAERLAELSGVKLGPVTSIVAVKGAPPVLSDEQVSKRVVDLQVTYGIIP